MNAGLQCHLDISRHHRQFLTGETEILLLESWFYLSCESNQFLGFSSLNICGMLINFTHWNPLYSCKWIVRILQWKGFGWITNRFTSCHLIKKSNTEITAFAYGHHHRQCFTCIIKNGCRYYQFFLRIWRKNTTFCRKERERSPVGEWRHVAHLGIGHGLEFVLKVLTGPNKRLTLSPRHYASSW